MYWKYIFISIGKIVAIKFAIFLFLTIDKKHLKKITKCDKIKKK